jgi:hypothetical protein
MIDYHVGDLWPAVDIAMRALLKGKLPKDARGTRIDWVLRRDWPQFSWRFGGNTSPGRGSKSGVSAFSPAC